MDPMIFASTAVGLVTLVQVMFITIMWQRLRDLDKKIDGAVAQLRAEMHQMAAELRAEMRQLAAELRAEMQQLAAELRELRAEMHQGFHRTDGMVAGLAERFGQIEQRVSRLEGREKTPAVLGS